MTLREKQSLFVKLVAQLILWAYEQGYELTFGDAYAQSGHKPNSNHYIRLAIDLNLFKDGKYLTQTEDHKLLGEYWESLHPLCRWGGRFRDGNHYSLEHEGRM
ncbi:MAG: M15 family metallopeptidase [candidate division WOR-3 bacterium]